MAEAYTFGDFVLEVGERRLRRQGDVIPLAPKAFDLLVSLVRHAGRLIGKQELLEEVWAGAFVEEGILAVHVSALRKALGDSARPASYIETVTRAGYRFVAPVSPREVHRQTIPGRWSIAVLPARPPSGGSDGERLIGLAITDALIERLGRSGPLVVRPTAAVQTYAQDIDDPAAIGRLLRTDAIVHPSFRRTAQGGLHVAAQLLRSEDGTRLWEGEFADTPAMPAASAVADAVAGELGLALTPGRDPDRAATRPAGTRARPQVYELCGRGRAHLLAASMFEVRRAVDAFRAAADLDPAYAPAHAGLALAHCAQAAMRVAPPLDAHREARTAALRALAMDPACADALVALGCVLMFAEWDWHGAARSLRRALDVNPSHVQGSLIFGRLLDALGRHDEALETKLAAFERDPLSPLVHVQIAQSYWNQRRYDEAIAWANKALALDPRHLLAREFLSAAFLMKGDVDRFMAENLAHAAAFGLGPDALAPLEAAYVAGGRAGVVRYCIAQSASGPQAVPAFQLALWFADAGDPDTAFLHLDQAILERDPSLVDLAVAPQWDCLRGDPRFDARIERLGLPPAAPRDRRAGQPAAS